MNSINMNLKFTFSSYSFILIMITLNLISLISVETRGLYNQFSLYLNIFFVGLSIMLSKHLAKGFIKFFAFSIVFLAYLAATLSKTSGGWGSVVTAYFGLFYLYALSEIQISARNIKYLMGIMVFSLVLLTIFSYGYFDMFYSNRSEVINSNIIASTIVSCIIYIDLLHERSSMRNSKLLLFVLYGLAIYGVFNCSARMSLLVIFLFLILNHVFPKSVFNKTTIPIIALILFVFSLVMPFAYVYLFQNGYQLNQPILGKSLYTGREMLWSEFIYYMGDDVINWLFGIGSKITIAPGTSTVQHLHNNALSIITSFGIVGLMFFYGCIFTFLHKTLRNREIDDFDKSCYITFLVYLVEGLTENSMVGLGVFPLLGIGIMMGYSNHKAVLSRNYKHL